MTAPEAWTKVVLKEIFRKGNMKDRRTTAQFARYGRICTLATVDKVFSTLLYNRLSKTPDTYQSSDQGRFERIFQTTDHLVTYRLLEQKNREWSVSMWVATINLAKAFDTIRHEAI